MTKRRMGLVMYRQGNVVDHTPIQWLPVAPPPQDARRPGTLGVCVQAPGRNHTETGSHKVSNVLHPTGHSRGIQLVGED